MKSLKTVKVNSGVANPSIAYNAMYEKWKLPITLLGGTAEMRKARTLYLPQEERESEEAYDIRLKRTVLYNVYKRVINSLAGNAFTKSVMVNGVPPELADLEFNIDGTGRTITEIAYEIFKDTLVFGKAHALADFPAVDTEGMSLTEFRDAGYRPYLTLVSPLNLIGWDYTTQNGKVHLDRIRIYSEEIEQSSIDEFEDKIVRYVRVVYPTYTDVYKFDSEIDEGFGLAPDSTSENTLGYIPLLTAYAEKTGFLESTPPLEDLAYLNLRHWQSQSDQANILHVARVPILFASGFDDTSLQGITIGANQLVVASDPESKLAYIEHGGRAINAGRQDLIDLEEQMSALGGDIVLRKGVARQTATARLVDQSESLSVIQLTLRNIERMLEQFYRIAGEYIGVDASDVSIRIGGDLGLFQDPNSYSSLENLRTTLGLNQEETIQLAKSLNLIPSYMNPKGDWKPEPDDSETEVSNETNQEEVVEDDDNTEREEERD